MAKKQPEYIPNGDMREFIEEFCEFRKVATYLVVGRAQTTLNLEDEFLVKLFAAYKATEAQVTLEGMVDQLEIINDTLEGKLQLIAECTES